MKIVFIGGRDIRTIGGIESYMYNLATFLVMEGFEPVVYCESNRRETEFVNGFKVIHNKSIGGRYLCKILLSFKATFHALRNEKDAVVYHYNAWPPALASWLPRIFGKKPVFQNHGFEWKRTKYSPAQRKILKFMEYFFVSIMKNVIAVSKEQSDFFLSRYGKKSVTITSAVNLPSDKIRSNILRDFDLDENGYFLFLGRLVQEKNPDFLIKGYIKSGIKSKKLVIAGSNNSNPGYVRQLHKLGADNDKIIFTGSVHHEDKEMLISKCCAFCIPSTIEGLSITLLEAMSYGKICLASDIPANKEALGTSAVWVKHEDSNDLSEKLLFILNNYKGLEKQSRINVSRIVTHFTWAKITKLYAKYINSII